MTRCPHDAPVVGRACPHLLVREQSYHVRFTGRGKDLELVCAACVGTPGPLVEICEACREQASCDGLAGISGTPEVLDASIDLTFEHARVALPDDFVDVEPIIDGDRAMWLALARDGRVVRWDADRGDVRTLAKVEFATDQPVTLRVSRDGRFAGIATRRGLAGAIVELAGGRITMALARDNYHAEHCDFSLAFVEHGGRTLVVHATEWNRLDVSDAATGELLTPRGPTRYGRDEQRPPHYLDYFHCGLVVSPGHCHIADNGWVWHPVGCVATWSLDAWLAGNVWESEDGPTLRTLCRRDYFWDGPLTWLDDTRLAVWGYGTDDEHLIAAVRVFDVTTGAELDWFPGPRGALVFDRELVSLDGLTLWDVERGTRLARYPAQLARYHPGAKIYAGLPAGGELATCRVRGIDAATSWSTPMIRALARRIAHDRAFAELPVLGDALLLAGCPDADMIAHCHAPGEHGARCWVLDRLVEP